jgi:hypothetical protein
VVGEEESPEEGLSDEVDNAREKNCNLASFTKGVFVNTLDPGITGMALSVTDQKSVKCQSKHTHHDATGLGERSLAAITVQRLTFNLDQTHPTGFRIC